MKQVVIVFSIVWGLIIGIIYIGIYFRPCCTNEEDTKKVLEWKTQTEQEGIKHPAITKIRWRM